MNYAYFYRMKKECKKHGYVEHTKRKDQNSYRCNKCSVEQVQRRRLKVKEMAVEYLGGKCQICGYNKYIGALEFHHRDPKEKDFSIGYKGYTRSWKRVKKELDKCDLLCSNCHKEMHASEA